MSELRRPPVALIITSQEWSSLSIGTLFAPRGYAMLRAYRGSDAVRRVTENPPDLVIIDRDMRDMAAAELCRALREAPAFSPNTPIVVIGPKPWQQEDRIRALQAGAWEVVGLPADVEELLLRIETWVRAKQAADLSRAEALLDPHTQLYTAHGLLKRLQELGAGAERYRRALACVMLSPEISIPLKSAAEPRIGIVNVPGSDSESDPATDLKVRIAAALRAAGRTSDTIALMNDREFVVVAPETDSDGAVGLANRLKRAMELALSHHEMPVRIRAGCYAVADLKAASISPTELLVRAAQALRQSTDEEIRAFTIDA